MSLFRPVMSPLLRSLLPFRPVLVHVVLVVLAVGGGGGRCRGDVEPGTEAAAGGALQRGQGPEQLARFQLPSLVVQSLSDTGVFPSDPKAIHAAIASPDKRLELIPGAHYFEDSEANRVAMVELVAGWARERI